MTGASAKPENPMLIPHAALSSLLVLLVTCLGAASVQAEHAILSPSDSMEDVVAKAVSVRPTERQIAWQRDEISAFVHFGMNTFTDREWGDGTEDPKWFNPTQLDCRQWVRAAKSAGVSRMILTAKHHDGFCLWPTKFTEHCVRNSPWKGGKGDVVKEFVQACRDEGLHYGIYLSPWDRHEPSYGDSPKYNEYFLNQLEEVLTQYPGIEEVWFDGACAEGPNGKRQVYDWRAYWQRIRELAPEAVIVVRGPDVRWCGNEAGHTRASEWSVVPLPGGTAWQTSDDALAGFTQDIYGPDLGSREALMRARAEGMALAWYPAQVNTSIRPGWFYHENEDSRVRSLEDLLNVYYGSVGGNAQFLLNLPPDRRGLVHEQDVARLNQLGSVLRATTADNLADGAELALEVEGGELVGELATLLDGNPDTFVTTTDHPQAVTLVVSLPAPQRVNCLMLQEHIASGQRVESLDLEVTENGKWRPLASTTVVGHKRLLRFPDTTLSEFRIRLTGFRVRPTLASLALYRAPSLLSPPQIERSVEGVVTIATPEGAYARYTLDGKTPTDKSARYTEPFDLSEGGMVTAKVYPLTSAAIGEADANMVAQAEFGVAKRKWKVVECDSQDTYEGAATNAIDDNPATFWHSRYRDQTDPMPHHLAVDLGEEIDIAGFLYLPRRDQWQGGIILKAKFEVSTDGQAWEVVNDEVEFPNIVNSRQQQTVRLPHSVRGRYFRLTALRTAGDEAFASAAEVSVLAR
jgi:alpha-L-fucosidase